MSNDPFDKIIEELSELSINWLKLGLTPEQILMKSLRYTYDTATPKWIELTEDNAPSNGELYFVRTINGVEDVINIPRTPRSLIKWDLEDITHFAHITFPKE